MPFAITEGPNGGIDTVLSWVGYTLPPNVENLYCSYSNVIGSQPFVGNELDNIIQACPLGSTALTGMEGNDTLLAIGRYPVQMLGGPGNDTLVTNNGSMNGGTGADLFVFSRVLPAHTDPRSVVPTIEDFNPDEGDRLHIIHPTAYDPATMNLSFDPDTHQLRLDLVATEGVDYVVRLPGLARFDPRWLTVGPMEVNTYPF